MGKFKESLKEEIKEEISDIVYQKAKEEIRTELKSRWRRIVDAIRNFFGLGESKSSKVDREAEKVQQNGDIFIDDSLLGILELFSIEYGKTMAELTSSVVAGSADKKEKKTKN